MKLTLARGWKGWRKTVLSLKLKSTFPSIFLINFTKIQVETFRSTTLYILSTRYTVRQPKLDRLQNKTLIIYLSALKSYPNKKCLIIIYKSLIECIFHYIIVRWGGLYSNSLEKFNIIWKYILRITFKKMFVIPKIYITPLKSVTLGLV